MKTALYVLFAIAVLVIACLAVEAKEWNTKRIAKSAVAEEIEGLHRRILVLEQQAKMREEVVDPRDQQIADMQGQIVWLTMRDDSLINRMDKIDGRKPAIWEGRDNPDPIHDKQILEDDFETWKRKGGEDYEPTADTQDWEPPKQHYPEFDKAWNETRPEIKTWKNMSKDARREQMQPPPDLNINDDGNYDSIYGPS